MLRHIAAATIVCLAFLTVSKAEEAAPPTVPTGEIYVGGHVAHPGPYSTAGRKFTILVAINVAGGEDAGADYKVVVIHHVDKDLMQTTTFSSLAALRKHPDADIDLKPDDQIVLQAIKPAP